MEQSVTNNTDKKWFVLRAISGKEKKVKLMLDHEIELSGWENVINQVLIPTEKVYKIRKGKKITQEKNYFPGYMLLEINEKMLHKKLPVFNAQRFHSFDMACIDKNVASKAALSLYLEKLI